jgi:hypothetical protein
MEGPMSKGRRNYPRLDKSPKIHFLFLQWGNEGMAEMIGASKGIKNL